MSRGTHPAAELCKAAAEVGEHKRLRAELARKVAGHGRCAVLRHARLGVHVRREGGLMRQQVCGASHICNRQINILGG